MLRWIALLSTVPLLIWTTPTSFAQSDQAKFAQWWSQNCRVAHPASCDDCPPSPVYGDANVTVCTQALIRDKWTSRWKQLSPTDLMDARWSNSVWVNGDRALFCHSVWSRDRSSSMQCEHMSTLSVPPLAQTDQTLFKQWWNRDCSNADRDKCNECPVDSNRVVRVADCNQALLNDNWAPRWHSDSHRNLADAYWSNSIWIKGDAALFCWFRGGQGQLPRMTCEPMQPASPKR